jgi:hypothetical protein
MARSSCLRTNSRCASDLQDMFVQPTDVRLVARRTAPVGACTPPQRACERGQASKSCHAVCRFAHATQSAPFNDTRPRSRAGLADTRETSTYAGRPGVDRYHPLACVRPAIARVQRHVLNLLSDTGANGGKQLRRSRPLPWPPWSRRLAARCTPRRLGSRCGPVPPYPLWRRKPCPRSLPPRRPAPYYQTDGPVDGAVLANSGVVTSLCQASLPSCSR